MSRRLYLRRSRAREAYACFVCTTRIAPGEVYYRDEPYPDQRRRGAETRFLCAACVLGGAPIPPRGSPRDALNAPYQPIGDGDVYHAVEEDDRRLELLEDLFPGLLVPASSVHIELLRHEAARIFEAVARNGDLESLTPRELEELLGETLRREGYEPWLTPPTRDGGRDVIAYRPGEIPVLLVGEAKKMALVEPAYVHRLFGVLDRDKANVALIATTGRFSRETRAEALTTWRRRVQLKDGEEFLAWVQNLARLRC